MAEQTNPVATETTEQATQTPSFSLGKSKLDSFYQTNLVALPNKEISYTPISIQEQTVDSITDQVSKYLRNYYDENIKSRQAQTVADLAAVDVDAASRGMTQSTYLDDLKTRYRASEAADIASINNQYNSTLAQTVQDQYNQYLNRKLQVDTTNAANQIEVDEWNANAKYALEELAYSRALQAYNNSKKSGGGSSSRRYRSGGGSGGDQSGLDTTGGEDLGPELSTRTIVMPYQDSSLMKDTYADGSYKYWVKTTDKSGK